MQIIDDMGAGGRLGAALGTGLQQLAQSKLNTLTQQHAEQKYNMQKSALEKHGIPSALGDLILSNPKLAQEIVPGLVAGGAFDVGQLPQETNIPQSAPVNQASAVQQLLSNAQQAPQQKISPLDMLNLLNSSGAGGIQIPQTMPKEITTQTQSLSPEQQTAQGIEKTANVEQRRKPTLSEALNKRAKEKEAFEERKMAQKEQHKIDKETLPVYKEINDAEKSAKNNDKRLPRMEELINRGNLSYPVWSSAIKTLSKGIFGIGIDLSSLLTADTQEFDKLSNEFLQEAKKIFGSRLTDADLRAFMQMIPNSTQSDSGKRRVINNMKAANDAAHIRYNAMNQIIKENGGKRPANLEELINERVAPQLDALAKKFKEGYGGNPEGVLHGTILGTLLGS